MAVATWNDLSQLARRSLLVAGGVDTALRIAALADLAGRPAAAVRGPKRRWVVALLGMSSFGVLPIAYFVRGRR